MSRLSRWMSGFAERLAGRYYEGPLPPLRLSEKVMAFAIANPHATRGEWAEFASRTACNAYREGYARGFDWSERDLDQFKPGDPERIAEAQRHDFAWHAPEHLTAQQLAEQVRGDFLDSLPSDEARAAYLDTLGRYHGDFRVMVVGAEKAK